MTIVEALKKFYKGNAQNEEKLKEADSVLDAIRAKYGPYKGANVAEYISELINEGVTPSGGSTPTGTIIITENGEGIDVSSYAYADVNVSGGINYPTFIWDDSTPPVVFSVDMTYAQTKAYVLEYADEQGYSPLLVHSIFSNDSYYQWEKARFIDDENVQAYIGVPENVTEGVDLFGVLYGSDENFYELGD